MVNVHPIHGAKLVRPGLNLSEEEVQEAAGGYKRPADQIKELHRRGFVRASRAMGGTGHVILERTHYLAVTRGQFAHPVEVTGDVQPLVSLAANEASLRAFLGKKKGG